MMRWLLILMVMMGWTSDVAAQDGVLIAQDVTTVSEFDLYGTPVLTAEGVLVNRGEQAIQNVYLEATAYDAAERVIGAGSGYLVNACGAALLPGFALQPGDGRRFAIPLEMDDTEASLERVDVTATGDAVEAIPVSGPALTPGITQVTDREVVRVEWVDGETLRYGAGCRRDVFTELAWVEYSLRTGVQQPGTHPKAEQVTDALRRQLGLEDPLYFAHSYLSYAPDERRLVYQTELNTVVTAEPDGSFKRVLFDKLFNRTLQGIYWLADGRFLATYFGATGEPVLYFTASSDGQVLSESPINGLPSLTAPGASTDGQIVIIGVEVEGKTGYYLKRAAYPATELLFETPLPDNNWPGPLLTRNADGASYVLAALPGDEGGRLVCFNRQAKSLREVSSLPLNLASDERAWWWLSPDQNTIALAADGINGGLWLIDLRALPDCE